ncbi:DUF2516 family protein [Thalassiella azotivora]
MDVFSLATAQGLVFWLLTLAAFVMQVFALVDAARHPAQAYAAAGKLTKQKWLIILGVATAVGFVSLGNGGLLFLVVIAVVAAAVYLTDVRPALRAVGGRGSRPGGYGGW